jgi:hypothetical protein
MGVEIAALMGFFGLTSAFAVVGAILGAWMAWRIVEKAGFPGWTGLGAVLLTFTAVASIVPLILLWVFAYMRWPRDEPAAGTTALPSPPRALAGPRAALADRRGWRLTGHPAGGPVSFAIDETATGYVLTGAPSAKPGELALADPSVGQPHARLLISAGRLGLEDLGTPAGTFIDGARLLPEHGPRDISAAGTIRLGNVDLALSRA